MKSSLEACGRMRVLTFHYYDFVQASVEAQVASEAQARVVKGLGNPT